MKNHSIGVFKNVVCREGCLSQAQLGFLIEFPVFRTSLRVKGFNLRATAWLIELPANSTFQWFFLSEDMFMMRKEETQEQKAGGSGLSFEPLHMLKDNPSFVLWSIIQFAIIPNSLYHGTWMLLINCLPADKKQEDLKPVLSCFKTKCSSW